MTSLAVSPSRTVLRRVYAAQVVGSTIDGIALSTAVLYFSTLRLDLCSLLFLGERVPLPHVAQELIGPTSLK